MSTKKRSTSPRLVYRLRRRQSCIGGLPSTTSNNLGLIGLAAYNEKIALPRLLARIESLRQTSSRSGAIDAPLDNVSVRGSAQGFTEVAGKSPHTHSRHCRQRFKIELFVQPEVAVLSHRRVDPRRLLGFFKSLLLSCHLAVKADHMALHHAPIRNITLPHLRQGIDTVCAFP